MQILHLEQTGVVDDEKWTLASGFGQLTARKELWLQNNCISLSLLHRDALAPMTDLTSLNISYNELSCVHVCVLAQSLLALAKLQV